MTEAATLQWLLEPGDPWIRYNTLVEILGVSRSSDEYRKILSEAMENPPVSKILKGLNPEGGYTDKVAAKKWGESAVKSGYVPKYKGAAWKLLFLAELGADSGNERVYALGEGILTNAFSEKYRTFYIPLEYGGWPEYTLIPCFIGNMIWALTRLGFGGRPEVRQAFDWLVRYQRFDDGDWRAPTSFPYRGSKERCWGRHTCYWGVTSMLRAMTVVPTRFWTHEAEEVKKRAIDFVLAHRLLWSSHNPSKPIATKNTRPQRLTAPLTYYHDAVEIASTMLRLGVRDEAIDDAVEFVLSKRSDTGKWVLDNAPGPVDSPFGSNGRESKWITFRALRMLKLTGRFEPN